MSGRTCYDRPVDSGPAPDIERGDVVGRASEPARATEERRSRRTVGLMNMSTRGTGQGGIGRIDEHHRHPEQPGLVLDELAELGKSPRMQATTLRPGNRCPAADTLEVLKGDSAPGAFGFGHELLGDDVVDIPAESLDPPGKFLEVPPCTRRPGLLECGPDLPGFLPGAVHGIPGMSLPIGVYGKVDNTEVNSEIAFRVDGIRLGDFEGHEQVERALTVHEIGLPTGGTDTGLLVRAEHHGDDDPALHGHERDSFEPDEGHDPLVVDHGTLRFERRLDGLVPFVSFGDLRDGPDRQLRREEIGRAHV